MTRPPEWWLGRALDAGIGSLALAAGLLAQAGNVKAAIGALVIAVAFLGLGRGLA